MRIAQIAPLSERVPPKKYGGTERVIYNLIEELVRRGHEVTLFASGDSQTSARLISVLPKSLRELNRKNPYGLNEWHFTNIGLAYSMQDKFDIIHDHNYVLSTPVAQLAHVPVVQTIHGAFHEDNIPLYSLLDKINLVTISRAQRPRGKKLNIVGTVYNGLKMDHYPFSKDNDGYLLYVGRMAMEKGVHYAIEAAQRLDLPLIIAARIAEVDKEYFKEYIKEKLNDPRIIWVGEVNERERNVLMSRAMCLLHPVMWPEPFGLTMIEAMACGCPVVAFNQGSIPEVVQDGKSGFIVSNVGEMVDKVRQIDQIDRAYCRKYSLRTFNERKMADGYERIYKKVIQNSSASTTSNGNGKSLIMKLKRLEI